MTTKETISKQYYSKFIKHASSALKLSLAQIKERFADYPLYLINYMEKDIHEISIEIRFDKENTTLTCTFNAAGNCDAIFLFPDNDKLIEEFVSYLAERYEYSFMRSRFMLDDCYLKVKELKEHKSHICLIFYE